MKPGLASKISFYFFFIAYLLVGIIIFRDYGMSWDEELNRTATGQQEYNYAFHGEKKVLLEGSEKYHGPAFELMLLIAERLSPFKDTRTVYFLRHFLTFLFFWLSSLALFFLGKKIFRSPWVPLCCVLMYELSPRIFGESFYNSKDLGFLSLFTISLFTFYNFIRSKKWWPAIAHAIVTGFMIDIRITGVLISLLTIVIYFRDLFIHKNFNRKKINLLAFYVVFQFACIVF